MLIAAQLLMSLFVGLSILALIAGMRAVLTPADSEDRMQQLLGTPGATMSLRDIEMRASFYERAVRPLFTTLLQMLGRLAPQRNIEELHQKLDTAGLVSRLNVVDFLGLKILGGVFFGVAFAVLMFLFRSDSLFISIGVGFLFGILGFVLPNLWLSSRISARQTEILRALPDALDMMSICVNAGVGLQGAMQTVCENWNNPLVEEFTRVRAEIRLGRGAIESLENMGQRTRVKEMMSFVTSLSMAQNMGVSIAKVLPIQAEQMRIARRQKAEEMARQASIKMLFPLVFLIFPAMFAVILGPAVPQLLETMTAL